MVRGKPSLISRYSSVGRTLVWGTRGRRFKSCYFDHGVRHTPILLFMFVKDLYSKFFKLVVFIKRKE